MREGTIASAYDYPLYYEIAFGYQEVKRQVDFFQTVTKKFCKREAKSFLDIGCGPSPQLREIARRGYRAAGLDLNSKMLSYLNQKALEEGLEIETVQADMRHFRLDKKCDFAFCLSGSMKVDSNNEFLMHLNCVADALNSRGIYLLENQALEISKPSIRQEWTLRRGEIEVTTTFEMSVTDYIEQISEGKLILDVVDHGERKRLVSIERSKEFAPQELRSLVELSSRFKFLGFFKHLSLQRLRENFNNNIVLMQKKG
jgi:SAM-dependent methyltransferase